MRKLLLSIVVIAASLAYVTRAAMNSEGGLQALLERITFQPAKREPPPLDFDDPLLRVEAPAAQGTAPPRPDDLAFAGALPATVGPAPDPIHVADAPGKFHDGTYTGREADAYYGWVQVRARVEHGRVTAVEALKYPDDRDVSRRISDYVLPVLETEVVQSQSADVDIVSGATLTVIAYMRSLDAALRQAE